MARPIPLSGGRKILPSREDLERQPFSFFASGKKRATSAKYALSGLITEDNDAPVAGVLVTLSGDADDSVVTGVDGTFLFEDLSKGDYTVTPTKTDWVFTPVSRSVTDLSEDTALATIVGIGSIYQISGTISGDIASGVTVTLSGDASDSVVTGGDGTYLFDDLPDGDYTVTPTLAGYTFSPTSTNVTINNANQTGKDFTSTEVTYAVSGNVTDWEGNPLSSVTVTVTGDASDSTTTDGSGDYSINLPNGSYTLTPSKTGIEFTPASTAVTVSGVAQTGKDFAQATHTLSGTVSGDVASGVTITLTGDQSDSTTTAGDGTYSFTLPNGDYNVEPSLEGYTFSPTDTDVTIAGGDQTGKDFTSASATLSLPYTYDISTELSATHWDALSTVDSDAWIDGPGSEGLWRWTDNAGLIPDANSYTPSGVTAAAACLATEGTGGQIARLILPAPTPSVPIIRFAVLLHTTQTNRGGHFSYLFNPPTPSNYTDADMEYFGGAKSTDNPVKAYFAGRCPNGGTSAAWMNFANTTAYGGGLTSADGRYWAWVGCEMNFTANTITFRAARDEDADTRYDELTQAMVAEAAALDTSPTYTVFHLHQTAGDASLYTMVARIWIGSGDDAWPF